MRQIEIVSLARQTRLRQLTSHPFTIEKVFQEKLREDDIVAIRRGLNKIAVVPIIDSLRDGDRNFNLFSKFKIGLHSVEAMEEEAFGGSFNIERLLKLAQNEARIRGIRCGICSKANTPVSPLQGLYVSAYLKFLGRKFEVLTISVRTHLLREVSCDNDHWWENESP
jgi:hypothetical protein